MALVTAIEVKHWRNAIHPHPVVLVRVDPEVSRQLSARRMGEEATRALAQAIDDLPPIAAPFDWLRFAAALCTGLQRRFYNVPVGFGSSPDRAAFWFAMRDPVYAQVVATAAASLAADLFRADAIAAGQLAQAVAELDNRTERVALDQSVRAMISAAEKRGIPWQRVDAYSGVVRFGYGLRNVRQFETLTARESAIAVRAAQDKATSFRLLGEQGIPTGKFGIAGSVDDAARLAETHIGFPLVVKPNQGKKGIDVRVGLTDVGQVREAAAAILSKGQPALLQTMITGSDHRLLVVDGTLVAAARRNPAAVEGDGIHTVDALIRRANTDPRRGKGFRRLMNLIEIDDEVHRVLAAQKLALGHVPPPGMTVRLRRTANISTGGTATDFTATIHPDNRRVAERAARAIGLTVAGIDFITPDITRSWREVGGAICEVNAVVGLRPHWLANPEQDVAGPILDLVYPPGNNGRIPVALVTGSNGKTTTTRMLAAILRAAGQVVGAASTDGVEVDGEWLFEGDLAGPNGASIVLKAPTVTAAVLETARGGILKHGIYVDRCDVAALLNVDFEQVGIDGIDTVEQMAQLKRRVIDTATGGYVLNADDAECQRIAPDLPPAKVIVFTTRADAPFARSVPEAGGTLIATAGEGGDARIEIRRADSPPVVVMRVRDIPATGNGAIRHNTENALAAIGMAHAMGIGSDVIARGLRGFTATVECSPGRFNMLDRYPRAVLLDHASNPPALRRAVEALAAMPRNGRRIAAVTSPGNRPDESIRDNARIVAPHADVVICFEDEHRRRGRDARAIVGLLADGFREAGVASDAVSIALSQDEAIRRAVELATRPDDLIIIFNSDVKTTLEQFDRWFRDIGAPRDSASAPPSAA